jgi:hypothetical protein
MVMSPYTMATPIVRHGTIEYRSILRYMRRTKGESSLNRITESVDENPFRFVWAVDQDGYEVERATLKEAQGLGGVVEREYDFIRSRGGPLRFYRPLEDDGLWLRFAHICGSPEGVLSFVKEFGLLTGSPPERVDSFLETAALIRRIAERLAAGERLTATKLFADSGLPTVKEAIIWSSDRPEILELRLVPLTLRDALLHQTGEAITRNRHFRRCRNEGCPNWFRLGPRADAGQGRRTYTARREFCSDRCRVAHARRQKRGEREA